MVAYNVNAPGFYPLTVEVDGALHDFTIDGRHFPPFEDPLDLFIKEMDGEMEEVKKPVPNPAQQEINFKPE